MFESSTHRFVTAILFLVAYGVLEQQFNLGVIASSILSATLFWKSRNPLLIGLIFADCTMFLNSMWMYSYVTFLLSQTFLLMGGSFLMVRTQL